MSLPIIAIVGLPNVGKSRLFNRLTGKFSAIVDDQPGVTRDRHYALADWRGRSFMVVDTGGLIPGAEEPLNKKVWAQAFLAIKEADLVICLLDGNEGVTNGDEALVRQLRRLDKPVFFAVNKIDVASHEFNTFEWNRLGLSTLYPVSAEHGRGVSDLLEALYLQLPQAPAASQEEPEPSKAIHLSILGRPNVGKSTLLNHLVGEERSIVDAEPGTTRDAINISVERNGKKYIFVDTAGIKRKKATQGRLEKFSVMTSLKAMMQSEIVLFLLDATEGVTHHDLHLLHQIWDDKKGLLLVVNKWDLMKTTPAAYVADLRPQLRMLQRIPLVCISAKTGKNCESIWKEITFLQKGMQKRFSTANLNRWLNKVALGHPLPLYRGKNVKFYYGTQVGVNPPHVVLFANYPEGIPESYKRYLFHAFAGAMEIEGVPVQFSFRKKA